MKFLIQVVLGLYDTNGVPCGHGVVTSLFGISQATSENIADVIQRKTEQMRDDWLVAKEHQFPKRTEIVMINSSSIVLLQSFD